MTIKIYLANETETQQFGAKLATAISPGCTLFLEGNLGAGKTTLTRGLIKNLGVTGKIKSPTYTIVEPYLLKNFTIYHFDFYRVEDPEELVQIGITDYFTPDAICLIEWPSKAEGRLPHADLVCRLSIEGKGRVLALFQQSERGKLILKTLMGE